MPDSERLASRLLRRPSQRDPTGWQVDLKPERKRARPWRPAGRRLQYGSTAGSSVALAPMRAAAVLAFWAVGNGLAAAASPKTGILP